MMSGELDLSFYSPVMIKLVLILEKSVSIQQRSWFYWLNQ